MTPWWLQTKPFNWAKYVWLHNALHLSRTYCYYECIADKERAIRFFKRYAAKPTGE